MLLYIIKMNHEMSSLVVSVKASQKDHVVLYGGPFDYCNIKFMLQRLLY